MKEVARIVFESDDGTTFFSKRECQKYEVELRVKQYVEKNLKNITNNLLKSVPKDNPDFNFGNCYVRQDVEKIKEAKEKFLKFLEIFMSDLDYSNIFEKIRHGTGFEWLARHIENDSRCSSVYQPIIQLCIRFECIDNLGREFNQIWYKRENGATSYKLKES